MFEVLADVTLARAACPPKGGFFGILMRARPGGLPRATRIPAILLRALDRPALNACEVIASAAIMQPINEEERDTK